MNAARSVQHQLHESIADNTREQAELRAQINESEQRIQSLDAEIDGAQQRTATLEAQIQGEQAQIRLLARAVYYQPSSFLVLVARARSADDLVTEVADLIAAGSRASEIENRIAAQRSEVAAQRQRTEQARAEQVRLLDRLSTDVARLDDLRMQLTAGEQELSDTIGLTEDETSLLDRQTAERADRIAKRLQEEQERIIAGAMQNSWSQALLWIAANPRVPGNLSPGHSRRYRFVWPEPGAAITQLFGPTDLAIEPPYQGFAHFHTGLDLSAPPGTAVLAADDGTVAAVGDDGKGYGRYVVLSHRDGLATLYGHLALPLVHVGDQVSQGQPVGLEGSTGNSSGPHVHFELRVNGELQDPAPLLPPGLPSAVRD